MNGHRCFEKVTAEIFFLKDAYIDPAPEVGKSIFIILIFAHS